MAAGKKEEDERAAAAAQASKRKILTPTGLTNKRMNDCFFNALIQAWLGCQPVIR